MPAHNTDNKGYKLILSVKRFGVVQSRSHTHDRYRDVRSTDSKRLLSLNASLSWCLSLPTLKTVPRQWDIKTG